MLAFDTNHATGIGRNNNLRKLLERQVRQHGDKAFIIFVDAKGQEEVLTYRQFDEKVNRLANWLLDRGIEKGVPVMTHLPNSIGFLIAAHACTKIGAVFLPSIVFDVAEDLEYKINVSQARVVITDGQYYPEFAKCLSKCPSLRDVVIHRSDEPIEGTFAWNEILAQSAPELAPVLIDSMDTAQLMFTSGTTARPKAVVHTHANLLYIGQTVSRDLHVGPRDRYILVLPLFHVNAQCVSWYPCLTAGASIVICERFSASQFSQLCRLYDVTIGSLVAATLRMILAQPEHPLDGESKMWRCTYAIAVTDEEWDAFEHRFNTMLIDGYGLTETLGPCTATPIWGEHRRGSVGLPFLGTEVKIVDDHRNEVPAGAVGEIAVKGQPGISIFKEYQNNHEATARDLVDGWFFTGDYGRIDEDGYVYFIDRKKDVIQRGGENISAAEVERVLSDHPAVAECAVLSVPDPVRDEAALAVIRCQQGKRITEDEIKEFCRARMAKFKVPSFVLFIQEEFPKTSIGKIMKSEMKTQILKTWEVRPGK